MSKRGTALYRAFRRIVIRLGRWFARRLVRHGRLWLIDAMERRVEVLRARLYLAGTARRRRLLRRIRIRLHAIRWLKRNARKLTTATVRAYDVAVRGLPDEGTVEHRAWLNARQN